jgi:hypothetical protein
MQEVKLGIVCVYLLDPDDEKLIDIHLDYIKRYTDVNYKIYAACNRLHPILMKKLINRDDIQICNFPKTSLRGSPENRYYLEQLFDTAINDGCTHIATFHVDSFPVRPGWAGELSRRLNQQCPVASVMMSENEDYKPHTSFMMFTSEFYREYKPDLLLSQKDIESDEYMDYAAKFKHQQDSGGGFGFTLFKNELEWIRLERSNYHSDHFHMAGIYGDMIFHLSGAVREAKTFNKTLDNFWQSKGSGAKKSLNRLVSKIIPQGILYKLKQKLSKFIFFRNEHSGNLRQQKLILGKLFADPDKYIEYLRKGS